MTQPNRTTTAEAQTANLDPEFEKEPARLPATMSGKPITELPADVQQALEMRRMMNQVASAIANLSWGKSLDVPTRRAIAEYCHKYGVDPLTEVDVLGGNLYINSEYWLRRLGELRQQGVIADFWFDHIHRDQRLADLMNDKNAPDEYRKRATAEWYRTLFERQRHNVPEEADAACVCTVILATGGHPVEGCKWGGGGTSVPQPRAGGSSPNPIVEANPELSVESQSARRAMRKVASHLPAILPDPERMAEDAKLLSARIQDSREHERTHGQIEVTGHVPIVGTAGDPYGLGGDASAVVSTALRRVDQGDVFDPYADQPAKPLEPLTPPGMPMRDPAPLPDVSHGGGTIDLMDALKASLKTAKGERAVDATEVSIQPAKDSDPDVTVTDSDLDDRCERCGWLDGMHGADCPKFGQ